MPLRTLTADERGMTLPEVMVAMVIFLVGVLGTLILVQGSMSSTTRTTAREQATNLARDLVERSRQASYSNMTMDLAPATLRSMLPSSDAATALSGADLRTFDVTRRGVTYTVTVFACSIDDPADGAGQGDAKFCAAPTGTVVPGSSPPGAAAAVNVLGIPVTAGGTLLQTVCNAVGTDTTILNTLTSAVSNLSPVKVTACPSGSTYGSVPFDSTPEDLRRVRIDVGWTRGGGGSVSQTTLLTNPK
jgi:prepilin-type N-terminal cleavage/methylation domain-containing protein